MFTKLSKLSKEQFITLQKAYKTDEAIGNLFGITRQAVHQYRIKNDIPSEIEKNDSRNMDIKEDRKKGYTVKQLMKRYDLSASQVYRILIESENEEKINKIQGDKECKKYKTVKSILREIIEVIYEDFGEEVKLSFFNKVTKNTDTLNRLHNIIGEHGNTLN